MSVSHCSSLINEFLGSPTLWAYLVAFPGVFALIGAIVLLLFLPETPRALIIKIDGKEAARKCKHFKK